MITSKLIESKIGKSLQSYLSFSLSRHKTTSTRYYGNGASAVTTAVCYAPGLDRYVCVKSSVTTFYYSNDDGITWSAGSTVSSSLYCEQIAYAEDQSLFMACMNSGGSTESSSYCYSSDGITWSTGTLTSATQVWKSICYSPQLHIFVMVGYITGSTCYILYYDTSWHYVSVNSYLYRSVCWSPELGLFAVVNSSNSNILISSNGINWTTYSIGVSNSYSYAQIVWANELNLFFAAYYVSSGTSNYIYSSTDGISWSNIATFSSTASGYRLYWSNQYRMLFLSAINNVFWYSLNGINWLSNSTIVPTSYSDSPMGLFTDIGTATSAALIVYL